MNVPLYDATGLRIYRELMGRETRCATSWHSNYGPEALQRTPDPTLMQNLGKFEKYSSVPMPLDVQLRALKQERRAQSAKTTRFEQATFPQYSTLPVSQLSVDIWGNAAWHSQPKQESGAAASNVPSSLPSHRWTKRTWSIDHVSYLNESLRPAHVNSRENKEGLVRKSYKGKAVDAWA